MREEIKKAIEEYQCSGCVCGSDISCFKKGYNSECGKHVAGTTLIPMGKIFLGMPTGFCRLGPVKEMKIDMFESFSGGWTYDKFNVPVWKHLDSFGNTIVRGISPRINAPFLHVFIGDCISEIDCMEITVEDISEMD